MSEILEGPEAIARGVDRLTLGALVAFPTETVYGLGAAALDAAAVARVFALKGRPESNPLIVHVSGTEMARGLCASWSDVAQKVCDAFWEGPVTIVMEKAACVPDAVTAGGSTVALRAPAHPVALALIEALGAPIVGPSANPSGRVSPTRAEHVVLGFPDDDLLVIDGGACRSGIESTVLDLTGDEPRVLRPGWVSAAAISEVLGIAVFEHGDEHGSGPERSPGRVGSHYKPMTTTRLVSTQQLRDAGDGVYVVACSDAPIGEALGVSRLGSHASVYASGLYAALHEADASGASEIWIEEVPEPSVDPLWGAVLERLSRACR